MVEEDDSIQLPLETNYNKQSKVTNKALLILGGVAVAEEGGGGGVNLIDNCMWQCNQQRCVFPMW